MTNDKILDKLGKIKAHMESVQSIGNEQEAQAFASMLQNLLLKHKLEMTDIEYSNEVKEEPVEEYEVGGGYAYQDGKRFYKAYPDVEVRRRRISWIEELAAVVAEAHSCRIMVSQGSSRIWLVGHKSNAQIAEYIFITMQRAAEKISIKEYSIFFDRCQEEGHVEDARGFRASFLDGFVNRLMRRFEEEKRKMEGGSSSTALVRLNKEAIAVRQYLDSKKNQRKAAGLQGSNNFNAEGYARGKAVADSLRVDANAVRAGQQNKQLQ